MSFDLEPKKSHCEAQGCAAQPQFRVESTGQEFCKCHVSENVKDGDKTQPLLAGFKIATETTHNIKAKRISEKEINKFIGKTMRMMCGTEVKIDKIQGSVFKPTRFEVNNKYHIVMLDAFKQLNNDTSITQQDIDEFDQMAAIEVIPISELKKREEQNGQKVQA